MASSMNAGYALTLLGMGIVFAFIALLALAISLLSRFKGGQPVPAHTTSDELVAVIGAALHAHRTFKGNAERRD
jgi:Na+-transporting methylmalonyl-CoA/oxaloacetate decarboxylase gamma subunit